MVFTHWAGAKVKYGLERFRETGSKVKTMSMVTSSFRDPKKNTAGAATAGAGTTTTATTATDPRDDPDDRFDASAQFLKQQQRQQVAWRGVAWRGVAWRDVRRGARVGAYPTCLL
jgi:hypothetical protein